MPVVEALEVYEFRFIFACQTQWAENVRHWLVVNVVDVVTQQEVADAIATVMSPSLVAALSVDATYDGLLSQRVSAPRGIIVPSLIGNASGTVAGDVLPRQTAGLITLRSETPGHKGIGRMFVPFPSEASNSEHGYPNTAYKDLLDDIAGNLINVTAVTGVGGTCDLQPVIFHRAFGTNSYITTANVMPRWATHRSRSDYSPGGNAPI